jgi:hypothetical protein
VLLFGGRQSGKTTVLHAVEDHLANAVLGIDAGCQALVPVYVDLMQLAYDATPFDFFRLVLQLAHLACVRHIVGFKSASIRRRRGDSRTIEDFRAGMLLLNEAVGVDLHFVLLLDEAKRVLTTRFPRGFQDNLFALMFGDPPGPYSFVLAGAQELYKLCEDSTSPIGSRAAKRFVCNLQSDAVAEIIQSNQPGIGSGALHERTALLYDQTGGHAGLSAALARRFADVPDAPVDCLGPLIESVRSERSELFQMWIHSFSPEARTAGEALIVGGSMTTEDIASCLRSSGFPPYRADRVSEELQFTGVARKDGDRLLSSSAMYIETARRYVVTDAGAARDREVWALIREVETGLRQLIRSEFSTKWPGSADAQIKVILGEQAWRGLEDTRTKSEKSYSHTARTLTEVLDCAYLGQLGEIIKSNRAWSLFRDMFRDKRELEDILKDVTPVRNDFAHFRAVPERELARCGLRCEDLLAILSKRSTSA